MYDREIGYMHQGGGLEWIFMLVFVILLIVGVVFLVKYLVDSNKTQTPATSKALDILEERFAKGEMDSKEFAEKRDVLLAKTTNTPTDTK